MTQAIEKAAGGFVFRKTTRGREVLLIDDAYGKVAFPKGHLELGEMWAEAAIREILEETGIEARLIAPLGRLEYPITSGGNAIRKQVRFFLLEAIDETDEPKPQEEEVAGAYYLPWDEAERRHTEHGYANWAWVFDKADALYAWHESHLENRWRNHTVGSGAKAADTDVLWEEAQPVVQQLIDAVHAELNMTAPELITGYALPHMGLIDAGQATTLPRQDPISTADLVRAIEHTLLKPDAGVLEIENLCREAAEHHFPLVCLNPQHVQLAAEKLTDSATEVCTVIGFPLGATTPASLARELTEVAKAGATEVDMVIPIGSLCEDDIWTVYAHIQAAVAAAIALEQKPALKVILETSALTFEQVIKGSIIACAAGANFIKTSTGFHTAGARLADVAAMRLVAGNKCGVKASGGVRTRDAAMAFLRYGADRLGTSSGVQLIR